MIKKHVDSILIGQNYISFLIAFDQLSKAKDVLILDDKRIHNSRNYYSYFSSLEKCFIQSWAQDLEVDLLSQIDNSLIVKPFFVNVDKAKIFIGRENPYLNFMELARKLPDVFDEIFAKLKASNISEEEFNNDYFMFCARTGKNLCLFKSLQNLNQLTFIHHAPDYFNEMIAIFEKKIAEYARSETKNILVYALRSIFQNVLDTHLSNIESLHLFICLLGPRYYFDSTEIYSGLVEELIKRGGFFRSKKIREWKFFKNKPWCVELDSFEGIVHPKNIAFIGGRPVQFPLQFVSDEMYLTYEAHIKINDEAFMPESFSYYFDSSKIGSNIPYLIKYIQNDHYVVELMTRLVSCQKASFHAAEITDTLKHHKLIKSSADILEIKEGSDVLSLRAATSINFPLKVPILDTTHYLKASELSDIHYIGPLQKSPLGLLSSLMESKDHRNFMS